jgi:hypothetical protein
VRGAVEPEEKLNEKDWNRGRRTYNRETLGKSGLECLITLCPCPCPSPLDSFSAGAAFSSLAAGAGFSSFSVFSAFFSELELELELGAD